MRSSTSRHFTWNVAHIAIVVVVFFTPGAQAGFVAISQPDASYLGQTQLFPITGPDFGVFSSLSSGSSTVSFDTDLVALTVPSTWSTWGSPPDVESSTPRVLWTNGFTSLSATFNAPVHLFGVELQPNTTVTSSVLASFFLGASLIGEIPLDVDGHAGARLFAASSTTPFDSVVFSSTDDFAIAQVRLSSVPEPGVFTMLVSMGVVGIPALWVRSRYRRSRVLRD